MYKILVVDDSALVRKFMCDIINLFDNFTAEDTGADSDNILKIITKGQYQCVVMNMSMTSCSGIDILERLNEENCKTPIVAIGSSVREDRELTMKALDLGAVDFVVRPIKLKGIERETFIQHLQEALEAGVHGKKIRDHKPERHKTLLTPTKRTNVRKFDLIAVASSTGGPQALLKLLTDLPGGLGVPIVIVQHMPVGFTSSLAERINSRAKITVKEAENDELLQPDVAYIAPGGKHMKIIEKIRGQRRILITDEPPVNNLRPCADVMYESLVKCSFSHILCAVLTGMGSDGNEGINRLRKRKNLYVITQNEESCVVYGMPKAIYESGHADEIVHINEMANTITKELGV